MIDILNLIKEIPQLGVIIASIVAVFGVVITATISVKNIKLTSKNNREAERKSNLLNIYSGFVSKALPTFIKDISKLQFEEAKEYYNSTGKPMMIMHGSRQALHLLKILEAKGGITAYINLINQLRMEVGAEYFNEWDDFIFNRHSPDIPPAS